MPRPVVVFPEDIIKNRPIISDINIIKNITVVSKHNVIIKKKYKKLYSAGENITFGIIQRVAYFVDADTFKSIRLVCKIFSGINPDRIIFNAPQNNNFPFNNANHYSLCVNEIKPLDVSYYTTKYNIESIIIRNIRTTATLLTKFSHIKNIENIQNIVIKSPQHSAQFDEFLPKMAITFRNIKVLCLENILANLQLNNFPFLTKLVNFHTERYSRTPHTIKVYSSKYLEELIVHGTPIVFESDISLPNLRTMPLSDSTDLRKLEKNIEVNHIITTASYLRHNNITNLKNITEMTLMNPTMSCIEELSKFPRTVTKINILLVSNSTSKKRAVFGMLCVILFLSEHMSNIREVTFNGNLDLCKKLIKVANISIKISDLFK